jgi:DNA-binding LacI/PurR family transcriptional regulator
MRDIARRANVSIGTVSRVLNRHDDVDQELRTRVEAVARKVGYRLSTRTRISVHTKSRIIGLILCNDFGLSPPQSLLLLGIEEYCSSAGYYLLFARHSHASGASATGIEIPSVVQTPGLADCVILAGSIGENLLSAFDRSGFRYVLLANELADPRPPAKQRVLVLYDDAGGCYQAVRYLAQLGHKHIWYIGDASRPWNRNRLNGYVRAISELELEQHVHTIALSDDEFENGQAAVSYIAEQKWPLTALVAGSEDLAAGAREGLWQHRREVPRDVSLIGFEHGSGRSRVTHVTSVSIDMIEVGRQLAKAAIAQIEGQPKEVRDIVVPALLLKRSTCRPLRQEDHLLL